MVGVVGNYSAPCQYVQLIDYDWSLSSIYVPEATCSALPWNPTVYCVVATLFGITIWAALELQLQLFLTFKRRSTLYFWSLLTSAWGSIIITVGFILRLFSHVSNAGLQSIIAIGWVMMTSGFAMVLYSRLYLIASGSRVLKAVFWMIIFDGIVFHTPVIVSGAISGPIGAKMFEVTSQTEIIFAVQELLISTLYVYLFIKFMQHGTSKPQMRSTLSLLIFAEALSLCCDLISVTLLYRNLFLARIAVESLIYIIKLKIEFVVLNRLTMLVKHHANPLPSLSSTPTEEDFSNVGGHSILQGFTETFAPFATLDEKKNAAESRKASTQPSQSSPSPLVGQSKKTPAFITRSALVDHKSDDAIASLISTASMVALERQYLGRFDESHQV
ncbi:hypothetical protein EG328_004494 [Venturia inaequalis]|uniref:DUF7703 domain-containing protein n=2 Tax=Venturia inaequalis TaxID=5025 RepID=A0A8H3UQ07_VENIN|nr:hypothetical protein EG327_009432 [Venturia inaequalis]KAE9973266.1 hypothetical protein EG328_004494 [Venturia inaequalis]